MIHYSSSKHNRCVLVWFSLCQFWISSLFLWHERMGSDWLNSLTNSKVVIVRSIHQLFRGIDLSYLIVLNLVNCSCEVYFWQVFRSDIVIATNAIFNFQKWFHMSLNQRKLLSNCIKVKTKVIFLVTSTRSANVR